MGEQQYSKYPKFPDRQRPASWIFFSNRNRIRIQEMMNYFCAQVYAQIHLFLLTSESFNSSIEKLQSMPAFFEDAMDWGIDASYKAMGFMSLMALAIYLFKK